MPDEPSSAPNANAVDFRLRRIQEVIEFASKNFALLSVSIAIFSAVMAIIFIAAYLRVFDLRLIWIIEYPDILKIGLTVVALFSGFSWYIFSSSQDAINLTTKHGLSWELTHLFGASI